MRLRPRPRERVIDTADWQTATAVIVPARNEADDVGDVVVRTRRQGFDVVVVDDFSDDATAAIAERAGAVVMRLPFQAGAWVAMQTGIRYALRRGYRFVVTLDADGQHDPGAIGQLIGAFEAPARPPNVVVGACTGRGSLGRRIAWRFLRHLGSVHVRDLTSGYRLYDERAMRLVASRGATLLDYQDVGVLLLLMDAGCAVVEVDIPMAPRRHGHSKIFQSWLKVLYYLVYSVTLVTTKRPLPRLFRPS